MRALMCGPHVSILMVWEPVSLPFSIARVGMISFFCTRMF